MYAVVNHVLHSRLLFSMRLTQWLLQHRYIQYVDRSLTTPSLSLTPSPLSTLSPHSLTPFSHPLPLSFPPLRPPCPLIHHFFSLFCVFRLLSEEQWKESQNRLVFASSAITSVGTGCCLSLLLSLLSSLLPTFLPLFLSHAPPCESHLRN